jgi:predicted dehydrogenase
MPDTAEVGHHPFQAEIDHFVDCILSDRESHCNLEDAVNTHEAALAAIISEKEDNRKVKLPLIK